VARRSTLIATGLYLMLGLIPPLLGLIAWRTLPGISEPETVLMRVADSHLSLPLYVLFAGALTSAILSTVNSALLVGGSLFAHNLLVPALGVTDDKKRLRIDRFAVVGSGVVAYGLALGSSGVYELVEQAAAFGTAGIFVITVFGLWSRVGSQASAYAALAAGALVYAVGEHFSVLAHPYITALAVAFAAYLGAALLPRRAEA
jgi:SSS family solute:Na+ symporter